MKAPVKSDYHREFDQMVKRATPKPAKPTKVDPAKLADTKRWWNGVVEGSGRSP